MKVILSSPPFSLYPIPSHPPYTPLYTPPPTPLDPSPLPSSLFPKPGSVRFGFLRLVWNNSPPPSPFPFSLFPFPKTKTKTQNQNQNPLTNTNTYAGDRRQTPSAVSSGGARAEYVCRYIYTPPPSLPLSLSLSPLPPSPFDKRTTRRKVKVPKIIHLIVHTSKLARGSFSHVCFLNYLHNPPR